MKKYLCAILSSIIVSGCSFNNNVSNENVSSEDVISSEEEIYSSSENTSSFNFYDEDVELLKDSDFSSLSSWMLYPNDTSKLNVLNYGNGVLEIDVDNSNESEYWGIQVFQSNIILINGGNYEINFTIQSETSRYFRFLIQSQDYSLYTVDETIYLTADESYTFSKKFKATKTETYLYGFMLGNVEGVISGPHNIKISNPSLKGQESYIKSNEGVDGTIEEAPTTKKDRKLVWSDEFNDDSLDTSIWSFDIGTGSWGWGNNEQQYYTNRETNIKESNGSLKIIARKEQYSSSNYTSARIVSKGEKEFKYGYFEARLSLPSLSGIWPAFWMLGANIDEIGWPKCGEIDIMEAVNFNNVVYTTLHWNSSGSAQSDPTNHASYGNDGYLVKDRTLYHTYGIEWDENYIRTYVDDVQVYSLNISSIDAFQKEHYFLFNVAVGGQWPGYNIGDIFPQTMSIDYLRVYQ